MSSTATPLSIGTRDSPLARLQAHAAVDLLAGLLPDHPIRLTPLSSPGDRDQAADLRASPDDFFARDLDNAVLQGELDAAVHSAKDMPDPVTDGLDWFWLPDAEDPRDVLVLPQGRRPEALPDAPRAGISSDRRAAWCLQRFPGARVLPIRGTIEARLAQLDAGRFDLIVMAGAALLRLGLAARISAWIDRAELPTPPGQGALALCFRRGDPLFTRLRTLFVKSVRFVGAGAGDAGVCTMNGIAALRACDVCIHDALLDPALLAELPPHAERCDVGKRGGRDYLSQEQTTACILRHARRGQGVVRLKGGDPGLFGRLAEETEALESLGLPFVVLPGVSSLNTATTGTGLLLTRRGISDGFVARTARTAGGATARTAAATEAHLPHVFFMAGGVAGEIAAQLARDGWPDDTPMAAVFAAGSEDETVVQATLATLAARLEACRAATAGAPVLLLCGTAASRRFRTDLGALRGRRVLLTMSDALLPAAARSVRDFGGRPVMRPLIRLVLCRDDLGWTQRLGSFDWLVLTSPSAAAIMMDALRETGTDLRQLPRLFVTGPGTAARLAPHGIIADAVPPAGVDIRDAVGQVIAPGARVLRLRADRAGGELSALLQARGGHVEDVVLYRNEPIPYTVQPDFDCVLFASGSAVEAFLAQWGDSALAGRTVAAFRGSACTALTRAGVTIDVAATQMSVETCVDELVRHLVRQELRNRL